MADPYNPALADFSFSAAEAAAIALAMATAKPWDWKPTDKAVEAAIKSAKTKIVKYHLARHKDNCCYCRTNLHGAGAFCTDREHVLPKSKGPYKPFVFTMWNLAASCKRCNLELKKTKDDFVIDKASSAVFPNSANYLLIHPNFDRWQDHLGRTSEQSDDQNMVRYVIKSPDKGQYTYDYFRLDRLELNTFDSGQGAEVVEPQTSAGEALLQLTEQFAQ